MAIWGKKITWDQIALEIYIYFIQFIIFNNPLLRALGLRMFSPGWDTLQMNSNNSNNISMKCKIVNALLLQKKKYI